MLEMSVQYPFCDNVNRLVSSNLSIVSLMRDLAEYFSTRILEMKLLEYLDYITRAIQCQEPKHEIR